MKTIEDNLRELWDNAKNTNIQILSIVEEEQKKGFRKYSKRLQSKPSLTWERKY